MSDRRLSVRIDFSSGGTLKADVEGYKGRVESLGRAATAAQKQLQKLWENPPANPMGALVTPDPNRVTAWLTAMEGPRAKIETQMRELALRKTFGLGPSRGATGFDDFTSSGGASLAAMSQASANLQEHKRIMEGLSFATMSATEQAKRLFGVLGGEGAKPVSPMMAALAGAPDEVIRGMSKAGVGTLMPEVTPQMRTFDQAKMEFDRMIRHAGLTPNQARVSDLRGQVSADQFRALMAQADEADRVQEIAARQLADRQKKGMFSGKRAFAGIGWAAISLASQDILPGNVGSMIASSSAGAGIGTMLGPIGNLTGGAVTAIGASVGAVLGLIKSGIEDLFPSTQEFNRRMRQVADGLKAVDDVAVSLSRGELGAAAEGVIPAHIVARIRSEGIMGEEGVSGRRMGILREEAGRMRTEMAMGGVSASSFGGFGMSGLSSGMMEFGRALRADELGLRAMEESIRRGLFPGLSEPAIEGITGSGEVPSITEGVLSALMREPLMVDLTLEGARRIAEALASLPAGTGLAGAAASLPGGM